MPYIFRSIQWPFGISIPVSSNCINRESTFKLQPTWRKNKIKMFCAFSASFDQFLCTDCRAKGTLLCSLIKDTLFQNGDHFGILLFACKLTLVKVKYSFNFYLKNEATRANLLANKRILKWGPFLNKLYLILQKKKKKLDRAVIIITLKWIWQRLSRLYFRKILLVI